MIDAVQMAGIKARMALQKHPQLKEQVDDAWALMIDENGIVFILVGSCYI